MKSQELRHGFPNVTGKAKMVPISRSYSRPTGICQGELPKTFAKRKLVLVKAGKALGEPFSTNPCTHPIGICSALTVHLQEVGLQVWMEASSGQAVTQVPIQCQDIQENL